MLSSATEDGKRYGNAKPLAHKKIHPARPRTKASQEELKRAGSILGFMPLPRGAPPKAAVAPPPPDLPAWQKVVSKQSKRRRKYSSWIHGGDNKLALDAAVDAILINDDPIIASREIVPGIDIPRSTLERAVAQERARRAALVEDPIRSPNIVPISHI
jgi:hypothetical protein